MSMNKYMHPRNIYKNPPDFKELALCFPEFKQFVKTELSGKVTFDFKSTEALRVLSRTLLQKDFNLDVDIPLNKLIPTIPLRLNYILWLEDLLSISKTKGEIKGIDIGTGASCIYPLLAARKNGWTMLATEIDEESLCCAKRNVNCNSLTDLIEIIPVSEDVLLKKVVRNENYDFCMCNPPFFGSTQELNPHFQSRKFDRPRPKNSFCASVKEVVVSGGEVDFILKLISDSKDLGKQIKIYTCMIGHKKSLPILKSKLREINVNSFKDTEFCQGNTTRWGLAWTFCEDFDLKRCPEPIKQLKKIKSKGPLIYELPIYQTEENFFPTICEKIVKLLENLQMIVDHIAKTQCSHKFLVRAFSNTWSNQRRKRREMLNSKCDSVNSTGEYDSSTSSVDENETITVTGSTSKRESEDCLEGNIMKKMKISEDERQHFFKFTITIKEKKMVVILELDCSVEENREYLHQILQYIKNNFKS